jgi:hypothetical protein
MSRWYHEIPETKELVFINEDDFQVLTSIMLGQAMIDRGLKELAGRQTAEAVAKLHPKNKEMMELLKSRPDEYASFIYQNLLLTLTKSTAL